MTVAKLTHRAPKKWISISVACTPSQAEIIAGYLNEFTGNGVELVTDQRGQEKITAYLEIAGTLPLSRKIIAGLTKPVHAFIANLAGTYTDDPMPIITTAVVDEEDWGSAWKQHFKTFAISPNLTIKPSWEDADTLKGAVLEMDPGLAFGTGHHDSTRLALGLIDRLFFVEKEKPARVLDVGCGTGILAMACALFGSRKILALDNDPDAVAATSDNVERNRLGDQMTVSIRDVTLLDPDRGECFDLVLANITQDVLTELASTLVRLVAEKGRLILAGILRGEQESLVIAAYDALGYTVISSDATSEWVALMLHRRPAPTSEEDGRCADSL